MKMRFYKTLAQERKHSASLQNSIQSTVKKILNNQTNSENPGVLLGKIQSGKTAAFIGVIAEGFDNGIDLAIVLTKNSELLGSQTTRRIKSEFKSFESNNLVNTYYIHSFGETVLKKSQLLNKKVFIAIKNPSSIEKLVKAFIKNNPALCEKNVLIIDDEADAGSVGAKGNKEKKDLLETAKKINTLRSSLKNGYFLQVTATPYSLYLQPNDIITPNGVYKPIRPKFTEILEPYKGYIGGEMYFEKSEDNTHPAFHIHVQAKADDINTLKSKKQDQRILNNVANTPKLTIFRKSIENFLVAVAIRRAQYLNSDINKEPIERDIYTLPKFAFILHIDTSKYKMVWQEQLINEYLKILQSNWIKNDQNSVGLLKSSYYEHFLPSLEKAFTLKHIEIIPKWSDVANMLNNIFELEDYQTFVVNSDQKVIDLADDSGQLKLETGLNFFIGGQVLDRGITIENLIGFFYGRDPHVSQMDTVLQHARMYGNRSLADISVTRMYTSERIFNRMKEIHYIDESIREALRKDEKHEIIILQASKDGKIKPANANKISLGNIKTISSFKTTYPYGFETLGQSACAKNTQKIDEYLLNINGYTDKIRTSFEISHNDFQELINLIDKGMLNYDLGPSLDVIEWTTITSKILTEIKRDRIHCYVQKGRDLKRFQASGEPMDAPYTSTTDLRFSLELIENNNQPVLILLRQDGRASQGWKDAPFYWPVLVNPKMDRPLIFEWTNT